MNIWTVYRTLMLSAVVAVAAPTTTSVAQPKDDTVATPKRTDAAAPADTRPNTNTNPVKHRYWRHRGGKHPHYGSRRVRT